MISEQGQRDVTLLLSIACVFWVLRQILEQVLLRASRHYRELEEDKRHRFDLYVLSLINAVAVSAVSVYTIITNTYTAWNGGFVAGAFVGGYVVRNRIFRFVSSFPFFERPLRSSTTSGRRVMSGWHTRKRIPSISHSPPSPSSSREKCIFYLLISFYTFPPQTDLTVCITSSVL